MELKNNLLLQFKSFRDEINLRINNHSSLLINKFWVCGLLFYVLHATNYKIIPFCIALCFDFIIYHNLRLLNRCGVWIKKIEPQLFGDLQYENKVINKKEKFKDLIDRIGWIGITILMFAIYWV